MGFAEICVRGSPWIELIFQREIGQCLDSPSMQWIQECENVVLKILPEGC